MMARHKRSPARVIFVQSLIPEVSGGDPKKNLDVSTKTKENKTTIEVSTSSPAQGTDPATQPERIVRDGFTFYRVPAYHEVNYPPFECTDCASCLSKNERSELVRQHRKFQIFPNGSNADGLIAHYTRRFPYSRDKGTLHPFFGLDALHVYQYTFKPTVGKKNETFCIMWDYEWGLVRIGPVFTALEYPKQKMGIVIKELRLKDPITVSLTGGAVASQGYWMPYECARSLCTTFCWHIRWALTPVFGPNFIKDCLPPSHPDFEKFKIDSAVLDDARQFIDMIKSAGEEVHEELQSEVDEEIGQTSSIGAEDEENATLNSKNMSGVPKGNSERDLGPGPQSSVLIQSRSGISSRDTIANPKIHDTFEALPKSTTGLGFTPINASPLVRFGDTSRLSTYPPKSRPTKDNTSKSRVEEPSIKSSLDHATPKRRRSLRLSDKGKTKKARIEARQSPGSEGQPKEEDSDDDIVLVTTERNYVNTPKAILSKIAVADKKPAVVKPAPRSSAPSACYHSLDDIEFFERATGKTYDWSRARRADPSPPPEETLSDQERDHTAPLKTSFNQVPMRGVSPPPQPPSGEDRAFINQAIVDHFGAYIRLHLADGKMGKGPLAKFYAKK